MSFYQNLRDDNFRIEEYGYAEVKQEWSEMVTIFPYYRIYLITGGEGVLHLKDTDRILKPGHLYFIPAYQIMSGECNTYLKHFFLHFSTENYIDFPLRFSNPSYEVPASKIDLALFKEFISIDSQKDNLSDKIKQSGILRYLISKFYKDSSFVSKENLKFEPAIQYVNEHIQERISVTQLAATMNLSKVYFSNLFTKSFGIPPVKYINQRKLNLAAKKIIGSDLSIKEISYLLGFENEMYFSRVFKNEFGVSPLSYKKEYFSNKKRQKNKKNKQYI
jgi:AraC-like DNA-binding protein